MENNLIESAEKLIPKLKYEPNYVGYFVKQDDVDLGDEPYCEKCIGYARWKARKDHTERRNKILLKYKEVEETGFYNGNDCSKYSKEDLEKSKEHELKEFPEKTKFTYEMCDPDFSGGETEPLSCAGCGEYFHTNFEPDKECANYLLKDLNENVLNDEKQVERFLWKIGICFYNFNHLEKDVQEILLKCAEIIIKKYS